MIFGRLKRLYHWVVGWSDRPAAVRALFAIAFAESSFFPIPPDVLLVPLCLGRPRRAFGFATVCTIGSVLGGMAGYGLGYALTDVAHHLLHAITTPEVVERVRAQFAENAFLYVVIAGFTPIPYKVFTISAGIFGISFPVFVAASVLSRGARFFLEALLLRLFGERAKHFLETRFEMATIGLVVAGLAGFFAVKYLL